MKMRMTHQQIRKTFQDYFAESGHLIIPSFSLIPVDDPTLLVINSGMAPLKSYFTGEKSPPRKRLCDIQKCVRTKDIESVGDSHHLTFFEMMGNWSIGDYFKQEAIALAWKMIKEVFGFDVSRIYVTVYGGDANLSDIPPDDESHEIWTKFVDPARIIPLDAESNFWGPTGETGPCGPCTEIFIDRGPENGCRKATCGPACGCGRFLEIWNAGVFMQYHLHENGQFTELPFKNVDAGAGLERFALILQETGSVYETDLFGPIIEVLISGTNLNSGCKSIRIVADHVRCAAFMLADGIVPANTRREYVLRRIIRKGLLHANLTEIESGKLLLAADATVELFRQQYPELGTSQEKIRSVLTAETNTFGKVLKRGLKEFERIAGHAGSIVSGEDAFKLHDALGFPLELTKELAQTRGLSVDENEFNVRLEQQKQRSRQSR